MSDLINHSEAFELAHYKKDNSNVARCYLDHCKTLESLTRELAAAKGEIEGLKQILQDQWDKMPLEWKLHHDATRAIVQTAAIAEK